ncbi:hypothetical protein WN943_021675 [Citrus x changshan-huyou]
MAGTKGRDPARGDAISSVGAIELTKNNEYLCRVGWATYAERVSLWDSDTAPAGFQIPPNSAGGFLGLFNTTASFSSTNHIVSEEFDSNSKP